MARQEQQQHQQTPAPASPSPEAAAADAAAIQQQEQQEQQQHQQQEQDAEQPAAVAKIIPFYGFQKLREAIFRRLFCAFSVLHCHGVSVSGGLRFCSEIFTPAAQWCFLIRGLAAVAEKASAATGGQGS